MGLLHTLSTSALIARKASLKSPEELTDEEKTVVPYAAFIVSLLSEIQQEAKAAKRAANDDDATKVVRAQVKSLLKGLDSAVAEAVAGAGVGENASEDLKAAALAKGEAVKQTAWYAETQTKAAYLSALIPAPLDTHHLTMAITDAAASLDTTPVMKEMGRIMKALNERFPGQIDGALVRKLLETGAC